MNLTNWIKTTFTSLPEEIIFYGGSFNPWHRGHDQCLRLAPLDKPVVVVLDHSPFKEVSMNKDTAHIGNNLHKINRKIYLYSDFYHQAKSNPTYQWITRLNKELPQVKLSLLLGYDSFASIDNWTESSKLLTSLYALYIVSRKEEDYDREHKTKNLQTQYPHLSIIHLGRHPFEGESSTKIRESH